MKRISGLAFASLFAGTLVCAGQAAVAGPVSTPSFAVQAPFSVAAPDTLRNQQALPESPDRIALALNQPAVAALDATGSVDFSSSSLHSSLPPAESMVTIAVPARRERRIADSKYFFLNGLALGMGMFDVAMTQHCIADQHCREGNPMMPSSLGGQLGFNFGYVAYSSFISYRLKKHHSQMWFLAPAAGIAAHTAGVASGFEHY